MAWLLVATALGVLALGWIDPIGLFAAKVLQGDDRTRMQPMRREPDFIDVSAGEKLREALTSVPALGEGRERVLFFGNSQQYTASLPRGGVVRDDDLPQILSALFEESLEARDPGRFDVYNGSAPNQHYAEALWQALWWFEVAPQPPRVLVLQTSFDTFRKTGVRAGYQTLLDDPRFVKALDAHLAAEPRSYAADYHSAIEDHRKRAAETAGAASEEQNAKTWRQWSPEPALREAMERLPLFARRSERKNTFLGTLYAIRVLALGISPTTRRHIAGPPFEQNFAALVDLVTLAQRRGARVLVYNAPVNPAVDMFYPEEYAAFLERLRALSAERGLVFTDLADAVPGDMWGYWIDGPDPIHFNEHGHRVILERLERDFFPALLSR